ncbi:MAG: Na+/H+ antiporter [Lysobacter sp.]|nr:Na+/H+ antiporter [Lysobacter sp.]
MESIVLVLAMLLAVVASGYLARVLPVPVPLPLVQIAMGAMIAGGFRSGITLDPEVFFLLFLPPLLFIDGWRVPNYGLLRDKGTILELALGLVIFTVVGMGFLIHWMIPAMPLAVAFALAAIVSPTDALAVSSIAARTPLPRRLLHILQGESLLNDASGLVCFRFAVAAAMTGAFSLGTASLTFLWMFLAGVAIGVAFTLGVTMAQMALSGRIGEETGSPILVNLLLPFGAYLLAEELGASGILAAVSAGVTMSYVELTGRAPPSTRVDRAAVWDTAQFALNGIVFVLLGEQLPGILRGAVTSVSQSGQMNPWWLAAYAVAITVGLGMLRFAWVTVSLRVSHFVARRRGEPVEPPHWRLVVAATLAGVRGAITLAGVMSLPLLLPDGSRFPARELAVFLATAVILLSLLVASIGLPRVLKGLEPPGEQAESLAEERARRDAAHAAIAAVEIGVHDPSVMPADADAHASAAARVIARYQRRLDGGMPAGATAEQRRRANQAEQALLLAGLHAEREEIFRLARESRISDETSRKLVREVDLVEARYRHA